MRSVILTVFAGVIALGCQKTVYRSSEGQYCSTTDDDDPFYECLRSYDLVCINTYAVPVLGESGEETRYRDVYVCRLTCTPGQGCPQAGDVCCPGTIYGRTYGATAACVPEDRCDTIPVPDGGRPDTRPPDARGDAAAGEAGPPDGAADLGAPPLDAAADAAIDAPADTGEAPADASVPADAGAEDAAAGAAG